MIPFDVEDKDPQTQLNLAAMWGDLVRMKLAIRSGAGVNVKRDGSSPLHDACLYGRYFAAKFLIRLGADVDCQDDEWGNTPLMCVIDEGYTAAIPEELLLRGADPNKRNKVGDTAIQLAGYRNLPEVVELLLNSGAEDFRDIPCWEEKAMADYAEGMEQINSSFKDDRMLVFDVSQTTRTGHNSQHENKEWAVITRRNVPGYPPIRIASFPTRSEAVSYFKKVVVETPRVSLEKSSPKPKPSLKEYTSWLKAENYYDPLLNPDAIEVS